jgi:S-disulfanyl-L-cysteine oxidoreductase SoxD
VSISFFSGRKYYLNFWLFFSLLVAGCNNSSGNLSASLKDDIHDTNGYPKTFGIVRTATAEEISAMDIDITPDGHGLPKGSGDVTSGSNIYQMKCASCHGINGTEGPSARLMGATGDTTKAKTIGNYWPYTTTLFDYIRRAMPYNQPGSLSNNEVYSLTAYLLYRNRIVDSATILDAVYLPKIRMPAQKLFVNDDRRGGPEVR